MEPKSPYHRTRTSKLPANDDLGLAPMSDSSDSDSNAASQPSRLQRRHQRQQRHGPEFSSPQPIFPSSSSRIFKRASNSHASGVSTRASPPRAIHTPTSPMAISTSPTSGSGSRDHLHAKLLQSAPASPPTPAPSPSPTTSKKAPDWSTAAEHEECQARHLRLLFGQMTDAEKQRLLAELLNMCNSSQLAFVHEFVSPRLKKDPFVTLPNELCLRILTFIDEPTTLVRASQVSRRWYQLVNDDMAWKSLCEKHAFEDAHIDPYPSDMMRDVMSDAPPASPPVLPTTFNAYRKCRSGSDWMLRGPSESCPSQPLASARSERPVSLPREAGSSSAGGGSLSTSHRTKRRPKALTYRSHFKQRYQVETAWRSGGKMEQHQLTPDQGVVTSLHLTEDHIFVALDNAKIHVFDPEGVHQATLKGHIMGVWAMAPCGNTHLVSGGCDRDVRMWDVRTGSCPLTMRGHTSTVRCLKLADNKTAISGSRDTTLRIWDLTNGMCKHVLVGHGASVRCLDIHGDLVVSGSYDTTAKIWSIADGVCLRTLTGHFSQIYAVAFDGKRIATGSLDTSVRIWDPNDGRCLSVLQGHTSLVGQLQMRHDVLVTGGSDGSVRVWSLTEFQPIHRLAAHDNSVTSLQFDDARIVSGGSDGRVKVWDLQRGTLVRELGLPADDVWRVVFEQEKAVVLAQRQGRTVMEVWSFAPPVSPTTSAVHSSTAAGFESEPLDLLLGRRRRGWADRGGADSPASLPEQAVMTELADAPDETATTATTSSAPPTAGLPASTGAPASSSAASSASGPVAGPSEGRPWRTGSVARAKRAAFKALERSGGRNSTGGGAGASSAAAAGDRDDRRRSEDQGSPRLDDAGDEDVKMEG